MALAPHHVGTRCGMWRMHLGLYTSAQQFTGGMLQHNNVCVCLCTCVMGDPGSLLSIVWKLCQMATWTYCCGSA